MPVRRQRLILLLLLLLIISPAQSAPRSSAGATSAGLRLFVPLIARPIAASPFGFDLRANVGNAVLPYVQAAQPRWVRAGDVLWSQIEPVRGAGYQWGAMAQVEANIRRLREMGIEPTLVVQQSPGWAQRTPGRLCSPPRPAYVADFARFMGALVARYRSGSLAVNYWEVWNEPDVFPSQVRDSDGFGCWADPALPAYGGAYYGEVVKAVAPAVRRANPSANLLAGALIYSWPDDTVSQAFLRGMLDAGAGGSFDALSFHAYGEWGAGDQLIAKTARIRDVLAAYGLAGKPLFATEIAATCTSNTSCPSNFLLDQANYAARIYAEAIALDLQGALWYTLTLDNPGFRYSHLIDTVNGSLVPRQAYYAFRNSAPLLAGARYVGPQLREPPRDQIDQVQVLTFEKASSSLYVLWVPQIDFPKIYNLRVPAGAKATCTDHLSDDAPAIYDCSDTNRDGMIPRAVNELPSYVEVAR